jgi:hypothetical protein
MKKKRNACEFRRQNSWVGGADTTTDASSWGLTGVNAVFVIQTKAYTVELHLSVRWLPGSDRIGLSGEFVENCTKVTYLEINGYRIKYSSVLWLLELQTRRDRKVRRRYML